MNELSEVIKDQMSLRGWTVYRLAQESGVPYATLAPICSGKASPSYPTLKGICKGFGLTTSEFFRAYDPPTAGKERETAELLRYWAGMDSEERKGLICFLKSVFK